MARVWADETVTSRTQLLVLLAIADYASDEGVSWPSLETLSKKSRTGIRGVQEAVQALTSRLKLEIQIGKGPNGVNVYRLIDGGVQMAHPASSRRKIREPFADSSRIVREQMHPIRQEPSGTVQEPPISVQEPPTILEASASVVVGPHHEFIQAWTEAFQDQFKTSYRFDGGRDGKAVKELLAKSIPIPTILSVAKKSWALYSGPFPDFTAKQSITIHTFVKNYQQIELSTLPKNAHQQSSPHHPARQLTGAERRQAGIIQPAPVDAAGIVRRRNERAAQERLAAEAAGTGCPAPSGSGDGGPGGEVVPELRGEW